MSSREMITLGGGCFWCLEAVFVRLRGIVDVQSGYSNGYQLQPTYEQVCSGETGHVEVVQLVYDSRQISLGQILEVFFSIHDPTALNRQGNDVGTQYRSGIYCNDRAQLMRVETFLNELKIRQIFPRPVVTEIQLRVNYWPAENYHQNYFAQHPGQGYCTWVVGPKVDKFMKTYAALLKP